MRLYIVTCVNNIHGIGMHVKSEKIYLGCYETKKEAEDVVERESRKYPCLLETGRIESRDGIKIGYDSREFTGKEFEFNILKIDVEDPSAKENKDLQAQIKNLTDQVEHLKKYIKTKEQNKNYGYGPAPVEPKFNSKPTKKEEPKYAGKFSF